MELQLSDADQHPIVGRNIFKLNGFEVDIVLHLLGEPIPLPQRGTPIRPPLLIKCSKQICSRCRNRSLCNGHYTSCVDCQRPDDAIPPITQYEWKCLHGGRWEWVIVSVRKHWEEFKYNAMSQPAHNICQKEILMEILRRKIKSL
jgi:hypothetical protein